MDARDRLQWLKDKAVAQENIASQEARIVNARQNIDFWRARLCECEAALNGHVQLTCVGCGG